MSDRRRMGYKFAMIGPLIRPRTVSDGLAKFQFYSMGPWPFHKGSIMCRADEEAMEGFRQWLPIAEGVTVKALIVDTRDRRNTKVVDISK